MAFESKKNQMKQVLQEELPKNPPTEKHSGGRKAGQFTLKPENRTKLDDIAKEYGYNSASAFLDDWIENYEV